MSLEEERLTLAVKIVVRSNPVAADLPERFRAAHEAVSALAAEAGPAKRPLDWADTLLAAAWELTRTAHSVGTPLDKLLGTLRTTHQALGEVSQVPVTYRRKPRRDA